MNNEENKIEKDELFASKIIQILKKKIEKFDENFQLQEHRNQFTLLLNDKNLILDLLKELKENPETNFDVLLDITAIDWAKTEKRFELVYFLYSFENKFRLRIKIPIEENDCSCETAEKIYPSANWYEREVWDMYGIKFENHSDLRRFYMPEDFYNKETGEQYHPLRKDFPLMGIPDTLPLPHYPEKYNNEVGF
jgi:NADH-quinone oxidoreductase subunit C